MLQVITRFDLPVIRTHLKALLSLRNLAEYQKKIRDDVIKEAKKIVRENPDDAALIIAAYYLKCGNFGGGSKTNQSIELD